MTSDADTFALPAGTVTFLLSDIEGSTALWEADPNGMPVAVADHYVILDEAVARRGGVRPVEQGEGDSIVAAFARASDALAAALDAQLALGAHDWRDGPRLRVRIALHTAEAQLRDEGNYFGVALSRCARLRAIAHGGQTVLSRATHDLVVDRLPDGVTLVDCGAHRLRDLGRPEQVYALVHPDLPSEFGPLRSLDVLPNNLPDRLTTFVGRERELADARDALGDTRVLTLTGAGGCGKTRLALQLAADVLDRFDDGVWWVELAPLADPDRVVEALAGALGVGPLPGVTTLQAVAGYLASRRAVVVLDNCEHLLEACAATVSAVLEAAPRVTVLATSRAPLGVPGETDWRVPSLSLPRDAGAISVEAVGQFDAVRLFIERALKVRPNFTVTNQNAPVIAQLCQDLDGIPLAIELAAARVRLLSVEQITTALSDRFRLLTGGARGVLPRQQTLRASVDWSHGLLSETERVLFRRLGVFAGGFTLDAAEEVCAGEGLDRLAVLDVLGGLVEKSLAVTEEHGALVRFRLLETVRQYAVERLVDSGELDALRAQHRDAFVALAERAEAGLLGAGVGRWLDVLEGEAANLASAVAYALATDATVALRLCAALGQYWILSGRVAEGMASCEAALALGDPAPTRLRARTLLALARVGVRASGDRGVNNARTAIAAAEACGDNGVLANALCTLGLRESFSDPTRAWATLERAIACARLAGDDWALAEAAVVHATTHCFAGNYATAWREFDELEPLTDRLGDPSHRARVGVYRSLIAFEAGDGAAAREQVARARVGGSDRTAGGFEGLIECALGLVNVAQGDPSAALERLFPALERSVTAGVGAVASAIVSVIALAELTLGRLDQARDRYLALVPSVEGPVTWIAIQSFLGLANVEWLCGDTDASHEAAARALLLAETFGNEMLAGTARLAQARIAADARRWARAEDDLHASLDACHVNGRRLLADIFEELARVASGVHSNGEAARLLGAANAARTRMCYPRPASRAERYAKLEAEVRDAPGNEFEAEYADGAALSLEQTIEWVRRARGERKRPPGGWESLTPTELRVVELASEGLTNARIGERMFISPATVKVHLAHVYAKLDLPNRAALATAHTQRKAAKPT